MRWRLSQRDSSQRLGSDRLPEQIPQRFVVINRDMEIAAADRNVRVACGVADFGQRAAAGQRMAQERVAAVVNGERRVEVCRLRRSRRVVIPRLATFWLHRAAFRALILALCERKRKAPQL